MSDGAVKVALFTYVSTKAILTALIGAGTSCRFYPEQASTPNGTKPYVTYRKFSDEHDHHMLAASGLSESRFDFKIYAASPSSRSAVNEAFRNALDGQRGDFTGTGVDFRSVQLRFDDDLLTPPNDASDESLFIGVMDFSVITKQSIPTG